MEKKLDQKFDPVMSKLDEHHEYADLVLLQLVCVPAKLLGADGILLLERLDALSKLETASA
jgi:hypothetical protein